MKFKKGRGVLEERKVKYSGLFHQIMVSDNKSLKQSSGSCAEKGINKKRLGGGKGQDLVAKYKELQSFWDISKIARLPGI